MAEVSKKIDFDQQWADRTVETAKAIGGVKRLKALTTAALAGLEPELAQADEVAEQSSQLESIYQYEEAALTYEANWGKMQGLSSGYQCIDRLTNGFVGGELIVLGGYTSRGKTQLAVNMAHRLAVGQGVPVVFVSLEMTKAIVTSRFKRLGDLEPDTPIFYQAEDMIEPEHLDGLIGRAKEDGVKLVVVDHLHYFARGDNMLGKVGEVTRAFKRLAVRYNLPILLLSQLSRPDKGARKAKLEIPSLSDLKESSYIEQDADIVLMVHRDFAAESEDADPSTVMVAQRKNRNRGMVGEQVVYLRHDMQNGVRLSEPSPAFPA